MQNYYEKFIKYKSKYLKLLKQLEMKGGAGEQSLTKYINADETRVTVKEAGEIIEFARLLESEIKDTIVDEEERKTVKNTDQFYDNMVSFPFHIWMSDKDFNRMISCVKKTIIDLRNK